MVVGRIDEQVALRVRHQQELAAGNGFVVELRPLVRIVSPCRRGTEAGRQRTDGVGDDRIGKGVQKAQEAGILCTREVAVTRSRAGDGLPDQVEILLLERAALVELVRALDEDFGDVLRAGGACRRAGAVVVELKRDVLVVVDVALAAVGFVKRILQRGEAVGRLGLCVPDTVEEADGIARRARRRRLGKSAQWQEQQQGDPPPAAKSESGLMHRRALPWAGSVPCRSARRCRRRRR